MAKTKHNHLVDTIDDIITGGKNRGIFHLYSEDESFDGRIVTINGKELHHFATTSYLGLAQDPRLKQAAIEAIQKYGVQFPLTKTFLSLSIYKDLEESLEAMFEAPVAITKNSTLCHFGAIPCIIRDEDAVILDHQVHYSVQNACNLIKVRGVPVEIIRHNDLNMLEDRIKSLRDKHKKIWFMIDGVYSMFGDFSPINEIMRLVEIYPQLHLYVDDVHGMSWAGKNGTGWVMSQVKTLHERMVLVTTLCKSFGASGSVMVAGNPEFTRIVKNYGGALTFSAQMEPPNVAAALASAKIHLSDEIYVIQKELAEKIQYCNELIKQTSLPLVDENSCPLFYIGTGFPSSGFNLAAKLMEEGFYVNVGVFPAVPITNTGLRFTLSRHNTKEDIKKLIDAIDYLFPKMMEEEKLTNNGIRKAFSLPLIEEKADTLVNNSLTIEVKTSIAEIDKTEWNKWMGDKGACDWDGLHFMEKVYSNNILPEDNQVFYYFIIRDHSGKVVLATFFTAMLYKEDMLAHYSKSKQIEEIRKTDKYYLTSRALCMGSVLTEGDHYYVDKNNTQWKDAFRLLLDKLSEIEEKEEASIIILRDFNAEDLELKELLTPLGYIKVDMPDTAVIENLGWSTMDEYIESLTPRSKKHVRADVLRFEHCYEVKIRKNVSDETLKYYYTLYNNVKKKNLDINIYDHPEKMFSEACKMNNFEFIELNIKPEYDKAGKNTPVAVVVCYWSEAGNYIPYIIGMDYDYLEEYYLYKQSLFQMMMRAHELKSKKLYYGFSASMEKKKLGAVIYPKVAYVQSKDNFALEFIENMNAALK